MTEKGCDNCYYESFDSKAYPCSICIRGVERQDMWKEKIRDCRWTVELKRDEESCKKIFEICKKCKESAARLFDGERYVVCTKVGTPPKHVICFELSECPLKKWKFEAEPQMESEDEQSCDTCKHKDCCEGATYEYKNYDWMCLGYAPLEDEPPKMGSIKRPKTGLCAKCGRNDCEQKMEHIDNCNGYIEPQTDCGDFADRLAYERGVKHAWEVAQKVFDSTVTFYEAEDVAKQITKTEPQTERRG